MRPRWAAWTPAARRCAPSLRAQVSRKRRPHRGRPRAPPGAPERVLPHAPTSSRFFLPSANRVRIAGGLAASGARAWPRAATMGVRTDASRASTAVGGRARAARQALPARRGRIARAWCAARTPAARRRPARTAFAINPSQPSTVAMRGAARAPRARVAPRARTVRAACAVPARACRCPAPTARETATRRTSTVAAMIPLARAASPVAPAAWPPTALSGSALRGAVAAASTGNERASRRISTAVASAARARRVGPATSTRTARAAPAKTAAAAGAASGIARAVPVDWRSPRSPATATGPRPCPTATRSWTAWRPIPRCAPFATGPVARPSGGPAIPRASAATSEQASFWRTPSSARRAAPSDRCRRARGGRGCGATPSSPGGRAGWWGACDVGSLVARAPRCADGGVGRGAKGAAGRWERSPARLRGWGRGCIVRVAPSRASCFASGPRCRPVCAARNGNAGMAQPWRERSGVGEGGRSLAGAEARRR